MDKNLFSLVKLRKDMELLNQIRFLLPKSKRNELTNLRKKMKEDFEIVEDFKNNFSDRGWCVYDTMNIAMMKKANAECTRAGIDAGERVLLNYYKNDMEEAANSIIYKVKPYLDREKLIKIALEEHFLGHYFTCVPIFIMIIDGAVNDFTKQKGFFAEGVDVSAWDCLVGSDYALQKVKSIYTAPRKKTNHEIIKNPYRNGIIHGRDLNYGNEYVSCKCLVLLFAIADWMQRKDNEERRKKEFENEQKIPTIRESLRKIKESQQDHAHITAWKPRRYTVGINVPAEPCALDCISLPFLKPIVDMFDQWKNHNYGDLSQSLRFLFYDEPVLGKRPGACRKLFEDKELLGYKICSVDEQNCIMVRVSTKVMWKQEHNSYNELLEFTCIYEDENENYVGVYPWKNNGRWALMPVQVQSLYK